MKTIAGWAGGAVLAVSLMLSGCATAETVSSPASSFDSRIESLLAQMTLEEKIGQITLLSNVGDTTGPAPDDALQARRFELVRSGTVGALLNVVGVEEARIVQDYAVKNSRLESRCCLVTTWYTDKRRFSLCHWAKRRAGTLK